MCANVVFFVYFLMWVDDGILSFFLLICDIIS